MEPHSPTVVDDLGSKPLSKLRAFSLSVPAGNWKSTSKSGTASSMINGPVSITSNVDSQLFEFLNQQALGEYILVLVENGILNIAQLADSTDNSLLKFGLKKVHVAKLKRALRALPSVPSDASIISTQISISGGEVIQQDAHKTLADPVIESDSCVVPTDVTISAREDENAKLRARVAELEALMTAELASMQTEVELRRVAEAELARMRVDAASARDRAEAEYLAAAKDFAEKQAVEFEELRAKLVVEEAEVRRLRAELAEADASVVAARSQGVQALEWARLNQAAQEATQATVRARVQTLEAALASQKQSTVEADSLNKGETFEKDALVAQVATVTAGVDAVENLKDRLHQLEAKTAAAGERVLIAEERVTTLEAHTAERIAAADVRAVAAEEKAAAAVHQLTIAVEDRALSTAAAEEATTAIKQQALVAEERVKTVEAHIAKRIAEADARVAAAEELAATTTHQLTLSVAAAEETLAAIKERAFIAEERVAAVEAHAAERIAAADARAVAAEEKAAAAVHQLTIAAKDRALSTAAAEVATGASQERALPEEEKTGHEQLTSNAAAVPAMSSLSESDESYDCIVSSPGSEEDRSVHVTTAQQITMPTSTTLTDVQVAFSPQAVQPSTDEVMSAVCAAWWARHSDDTMGTAVIPTPLSGPDGLTAEFGLLYRTAAVTRGFGPNLSAEDFFAALLTALARCAHSESASPTALELVLERARWAWPQEVRLALTALNKLDMPQSFAERVAGARAFSHRTLDDDASAALLFDVLLGTAALALACRGAAATQLLADASSARLPPQLGLSLPDAALRSCALLRRASADERNDSMLLLPLLDACERAGRVARSMHTSVLKFALRCFNVWATRGDAVTLTEALWVAVGRLLSALLTALSEPKAGVWAAASSASREMHRAAEAMANSLREAARATASEARGVKEIRAVAERAEEWLTAAVTATAAVAHFLELLEPLLQKHASVPRRSARAIHSLLAELTPAATPAARALASWRDPHAALEYAREALRVVTEALSPAEGDDQTDGKKTSIGETLEAACKSVSTLLLAVAEALSEDGSEWVDALASFDCALPPSLRKSLSPAAAALRRAAATLSDLERLARQGRLGEGAAAALAATTAATLHNRIFVVAVTAVTALFGAAASSPPSPSDSSLTPDKVMACIGSLEQVRVAAATLARLVGGASASAHAEPHCFDDRKEDIPTTSCDDFVRLPLPRLSAISAGAERDPAALSHLSSNSHEDRDIHESSQCQRSVPEVHVGAKARHRTTGAVCAGLILAAGSFALLAASLDAKSLAEASFVPLTVVAVVVAALFTAAAAVTSVLKGTALSSYDLTLSSLTAAAIIVALAVAELSPEFILSRFKISAIMHLHP